MSTWKESPKKWRLRTRQSLTSQTKNGDSKDRTEPEYRSHWTVARCQHPRSQKWFPKKIHFPHLCYDRQRQRWELFSLKTFNCKANRALNSAKVKVSILVQKYQISNVAQFPGPLSLQKDTQINQLCIYQSIDVILEGIATWDHSTKTILV